MNSGRRKKQDVSKSSRRKTVADGKLDNPTRKKGGAHAGVLGSEVGTKPPPEILQGQDASELDGAQTPYVEKIIHSSKAYSGPLPLPEHFGGYEKILPGAAHRILGMAERSLRHSHKMEEKTISANIEDKKRGKWMGFIAFLGLIIASIVVSLVGESGWFRWLLGGAGVLGMIAGLFIELWQGSAIFGKRGAKNGDE